MKVICISGKAESGKDTAARYIKEVLEKNGQRVLITHFADLVKYVAKTFFDWNGSKDEVGRSLLQYVGTDIVRTQSPDYWVNFIVSMLTFFNATWDYVLIPDTRFPNEYELFKHYGFDTTLLRISRLGHISSLSYHQQNHPSENSLDSYDWDAYIVNPDKDIDIFYSRLDEFMANRFGVGA